MRDTASRCDMSFRIRKHDGFASSRVVETTDDACQAHNTIPQEQPIAQRLLQLAEQPQSLLCAHRGRPCGGHGSGNHRIFNVGGWRITVWMVRQCCFRPYFNFRQAMHKNMFPECALHHTGQLFNCQLFDECAMAQQSQAPAAFTSTRSLHSLPLRYFVVYCMDATLGMGLAILFHTVVTGWAARLNQQVWCC